MRVFINFDSAEQAADCLKNLKDDKRITDNGIAIGPKVLPSPASSPVSRSSSALPAQPAPKPALLLIDGEYAIQELTRTHQFHTVNWKQVIRNLEIALKVSFETRAIWIDVLNEKKIISGFFDKIQAADINTAKFAHCESPAQRDEALLKQLEAFDSGEAYRGVDVLVFFAGAACFGSILEKIAQEDKKKYHLLAADKLSPSLNITVRKFATSTIAIKPAVPIVQAAASGPPFASSSSPDPSSALNKLVSFVDKIRSNSYVPTPWNPVLVGKGGMPGICNNFWEGNAVCKNGDRCTYKHMWAPTTHFPHFNIGRICPAFLEANTCTEVMCHMLHVHRDEILRGRPTPSASASSSSAVPAAPAPAPGRPQSLVACYAQALGICKKDFCGYAHLDWPKINKRILEWFLTESKNAKAGLRSDSVVPISVENRNDCFDFFFTMRCKHERSGCGKAHCYVSLPGQERATGRICKYFAENGDCPSVELNDGPCPFIHCRAEDIDWARKPTNLGVCLYNCKPGLHACSHVAQCKNIHLKPEFWARHEIAQGGAGSSSGKASVIVEDEKKTKSKVDAEELQIDLESLDN